MLDTRSKILTLAAALRLGPVTLITGTFDGLRAAHLRELRAAPSTALLAAVLPLNGELVPQRARAEMMAGLRVIDYVVLADERDVDALIQRLAPRALIRMEAGDAGRTRELIDHVHRRQSGI
jgi:bifunctional ADP-heptose synthase (sugar kinase/adenylyltransferase)